MDTQRHTSAVSQLKAHLEGIIKTDLEKLCRVEKEVNFEAGRHMFESVQEFARVAAKLQWDRLPTALVEDVRNRSESVGRQFHNILKFNVRDQQNPETAKNELLKSLEENWKHFIQALAPVGFVALALASESGIILKELKKIQSEAAVFRVEAESQVKQILAERQASQALIEELLSDLRKAAAEQGVSQQSIHFSTTAASYGSEAGTWLKAAILIGIGTLAFALLAQYSPIEAESVTEMIPEVFPRFVGLSVLFSGLVFSLRNYSAAKHNQTINHHRAMALSTFEAFRTGSSDGSVKNAILLAAAQSAFAHLPTGYSKGEEDRDGAASSVNVLVDAAKGLHKPEK